MMGFYGGYGWLGALPMTLLWVGVLVLVVWGLVSLFRRSAVEPRQHSALDTLKERYARGEIDKAQFEQQKHDLS